jgi:hypothetical protein
MLSTHLLIAICHIRKSDATSEDKSEAKQAESYSQNCPMQTLKMQLVRDDADGELLTYPGQSQPEHKDATWK